MRALRILSISVAIALTLAAPAAAQKSGSSMSADLVNDLRDVEVQKQLIASGVLDAQAGLASRNQLRRAIGWFREAHKFPNNPQLMGKLEKEERAKLKEVYEKFVAITGLQQQTFKDPEPDKKGTRTTDELRILVPTKFVGTTLQVNAGNNEKWWEYRASNGSVAIGPELYSATELTPISIFKKRILVVAMEYSLLHLTSDELNAKGQVGGKDGYISYNLILRSKDLLKGLFMRYSKQPPEGFTVPDFLQPILATQPEPPTDLDHSTRGWQLLMQSTTSLVAGEFPIDNGWTRVRVTSKECSWGKDTADGGGKKIRILFGTDRKLLQDKASDSNVSPDSIFSNKPSNRLNIGCAYVSVPAREKENDKEKATARDLTKGATLDYQMIHMPKKPDLGDHLYLTGEVAESRASEPALVFIHGYNTSFSEALLTVAKIASDTDYKGRVYLYSWPSAQNLTGYVGDLDNAEQAEPYFQAFMKLLTRDADIDEIDILVHSMGSQAVLRGLSALRSLFETVKRGSRRGKSISIGQIIFAAPDVAVPVFDQKIQRIAPYADRVTVYASSTDTALLASKLLRSGAPRMGEFDKDGPPPRVKVSNVHVIDATGSENWWRLDRILFGQGHDYFRQNPYVLKDIRLILEAKRKNERSFPDERSPDLFEKRPHAAVEEEPLFHYWRLKPAAK